MLLRMRKAQSTLEYALIVAVAAGAFISMQVYIKRGLQGKLKDATDQMGEQYSPGYTTGTVTMDVITTTSESLQDGVTTTTSTTSQSKDTDVSIAGYDKEYWPGK
jgi:Flp pilus assembly pilin Flp